MARQLKIAAPTGQTLYLEVFEEGETDPSEPVAQLILTETPAGKGFYLTNDLPAGVADDRYNIALLNNLLETIGSYINVWIGGEDGKVYPVGDSVHDPNTQVLTKAYRHTNVGSGSGYDDVTITDEG